MIRFLFVLLFGLLFIACSRYEPATFTPVHPVPANNASLKARSAHYLLAFEGIFVDPLSGHFKIIPLRDAEIHWNVLKFLEQGPCTDCVKITKFADSGAGTKLIDIQIRHPFTGASLTGFDVRGIAMFRGSQVFPNSGLNVPNRWLGDGELVNADGFTSLYNWTTQGNGPGGLQGYLKGKLATIQTPNALLNGYKRHNSNDPSNTRNAFYAAGAVTVTYEIDMPDTQLIIGYAVDASWAPADKLPVIDPMTDFPPEANCPEPWRIDVTELPGKGVTSGGGYTVLNIDVHDHQGKYSHLPPKVECPDLFPGKEIAKFISDNNGFSTYQVTVVNWELAPPGQYRCLVSVEDTQNAVSPDWLDLTAYQIFSINVIKSGWARTWGSSQPDFASGTAIDNNGNVYVAGTFQLSADFNPGLSIDEHTSAGSFDCFCSKYSPEGKFLWARTWGGAFWDEVSDASVDADGNVYIVGFFSDVADFDPGLNTEAVASHGDWDSFMLKLDKNGNFVCVKTWGGGAWDMCKGISINGNNVYVTGEFRMQVDFDPGPGEEKYQSVPGGSFLSKFLTNGNHVWARVWAGDGGYDDIGYDVYADSSGNVYVAGAFDGKCDFDPDAGFDERTAFNIYQDSYLVKYSDSGTYKWVRAWGGDIDDLPFGVGVDISGNVYVTGHFGNTVDFDAGSGIDNHVSNGERDVFLTSYSADGSYRWTRTWGSALGSWANDDMAQGLYVGTNPDDMCTIYVVGAFNGSVDFDPGPDVDEMTTAGNRDAFLCAFDASGNALWSRGWGGAGNDVAIAAIADNKGNVCVGGYFEQTADFDPGVWVENHSSNGNLDAFLIKFLPDGVW